MEDSSEMNLSNSILIPASFRKSQQLNSFLVYGANGNKKLLGYLTTVMLIA